MVPDRYARMVYDDGVKEHVWQQGTTKQAGKQNPDVEVGGRRAPHMSEEAVRPRNDGSWVNSIQAPSLRRSLWGIGIYYNATP